MKQLHGLAIGLVLVALAARGQVTSIGVAEANQIHLKWTAWPGNPYRVYATPNLVEPVWSNVMPEALTFTDQDGGATLPTGGERLFYCALASDYLIVELAEGPESANYSVSYTNEAPPGGWSDEFKTTKLILRRIPGGIFMMGSPPIELGRLTNETPHSVMLTKDYYMGVFEVTQKQWERVMGTWPSYFSNATYRESRPVEQVSYNDIRGTVAGTNWPTDGNVDTNSFMGRLRTKTGQAFDLPTEAQWERACRAGANTALNSGYNITNTSADARMAEVGRYSWNGGSGYSSGGDSSVGSAKVGMYLPNAWGLYDMHGNVLELCLDWQEYALSPEAVVDPSGPATAFSRALRGGSWFHYARVCRSANRLGSSPYSKTYNEGFRVSLPSGRP